MDTTRGNIVLVYPKTGMDFGSTIAPPHALLTIAAPLHKEGYRVKIIDQRINVDWKLGLIAELKLDPICVGISSMTGSQLYYALEVASIVRKTTNGRVPIVWGGPHPSILPAQTCEDEHVDIVCVGEGDITFYELVKALQDKKSLSDVEGIAFKDNGKVILTQARSLLDVETLLPVPWELVNAEDYISRDMYLKKSLRALDIGQTSRGCPFNCGFCCSASLRMRKWRAMSVEKSFDKIMDAVRRFKLDGIWIRDDEFYINRDRAHKICELIIKEKLNIHWYTSGTRVDVFNKGTDEQISTLKKSGAYVLKFGAESGSDRILKLINKGITVQDTIEANLKAKEHGIIPAFSLIIGFPSETSEESNKTVDLMFRLKKDNPKALIEGIGIYTAFPSTPMYSLALKNGLKPPQRLEGWINWVYDDYDFPGHKIPWFSYKDRKKMGNISYMSILANAVPNVINSLDNSFIRSILKVCYAPIGAYYKFRLKNKLYSFYIDLVVIRYLRKKIFYRGHVKLK